MRSEDLYSAIGNMDDRFIDDRPIAEVRKSKRLPLWSKLVAVAACVALVLTGITVWERETTAVVYPTENTPIYSGYSNISDCYAESYSLNYADLAMFSDVVVVAEVTETFRILSVKQENEYRFYVNVKVCDVLKGHFREGVCRGKTICVQDTGFELEEKVYSYARGPLMEEGNLVLLFLTIPTEDDEIGEIIPHYTLAMPWIGVFFYDKDGCYHVASDYGEYRGLEIVGFTDHTPKKISDIRRLMRKKHQSLSEDEYRRLCGQIDLFKELYED